MQIDIKSAQKFLDVLGVTKIILTCPDKSNPKNKTIKAEAVELSKLENDLVKWNLDEGREVFFAPNQKNKKSDIHESFLIFADLDIKDENDSVYPDSELAPGGKLFNRKNDLENILRTSEFPPSVITKTRNGLQPFWRLQNGVDASTSKKMIKIFLRGVSAGLVDTRASNHSMRLPGLLWNKGKRRNLKPWKIEWVYGGQNDQILVYDPEKILKTSTVTETLENKLGKTFSNKIFFKLNKNLLKDFSSLFDQNQNEFQNESQINFKSEKNDLKLKRKTFDKKIILKKLQLNNLNTLISLKKSITPPASNTGHIWEKRENPDKPGPRSTATDFYDFNGIPDGKDDENDLKKNREIVFSLNRLIDLKSLVGVKSVKTNIRCRFCDDENPSAGVVEGSGCLFYHCRKCGVSLSPIDFRVMTENTPKYELIKRLKLEHGIKSDETRFQKSQKEIITDNTRLLKLINGEVRILRKILGKSLKLLMVLHKIALEAVPPESLTVTPSNAFYFGIRRIAIECGDKSHGRIPERIKFLISLGLLESVRPNELTRRALVDLNDWVVKVNRRRGAKISTPSYYRIPKYDESFLLKIVSENRKPQL